MKSIILKTLLVSVMLLLCLNIRLNAQDVQDSTNFFTLRERLSAHLQNQVSSENGEIEKEDGKLARFHRWEWLWRNRLGTNGDMSTASKVMTTYLNDLQANRVSTCDSPYDNNIGWTNLGPFNSSGALGSSPPYSCHSTKNKQNQGRIECISVNPSNSDEILIGSWNSGAWRTTDGGKTWVNTTDDEGLSFFGIRSIIRHPQDAKIIYATTGTEGSLWDGNRYLYGIGLIMSEDGGISWKKTNYQSGERCHKIAIDPNSTLTETTLFFTTEFHVKRWVSDAQLSKGNIEKIHEEYNYGSGILWQGNHYMRDIIVINDGSAFFSNFFGLYKVAKGATSATLVNLPLPLAYQSTNLITCPKANKQEILRQDISIRVNNQGHIVLISHLEKIKTATASNCTTEGTTLVYKSTNGVAWSYKTANLSPYYPGIQFNIKPTDSEVIYAENGRCMYKSINGGSSFTLMNGAENHPDVRDVVTFSSQNESEIVFVATDGGIPKTINGNDWKDITGEGLSIANFYGVGITERNDKMIFAGAQDNNINYYNNGKWYETDPLTDNGDCLITGAKDDIIYQESQFFLNVGTLLGNNVTINSNARAGNWMSPLLLNPANSNEFFVGTNYLQYGAVPTTNLKTDASDSKIHSLVDFDVSSVAMSRSNENIVYYSLYSLGNLGIFKATRKGTTWAITNITNNLAPLKQFITDIATDPNNENRIWVTFGGFSDGHKVFKTENGGTTWENVSGCLPNFPVISIVYQEGSNDRLYVGTDIGVFYRDNVQTDWAKYGNGGPPCMVSDMEINNCAGKLVVATFGRGLWEAPLLTDVASDIATATTWDRNRTVASDVLVKRGTTLKIAGTSANPVRINLGRNVKIIVEDGAKLEAKNAILTNDCGYMWQGIEAWGKKNLRQIPANQAYIILNDVTVEYAHNAITTWKVGDLSTTGAVVQAANTKFFNNTRSAEFMSYKNKSNSGSPQGNISRFEDCTFNVNSAYRRGDDFKYHLSMWDVDHVLVYSCTFKSEKIFPFDQEKNAAIRTIDVSILVVAKCTGNIYPCSSFKRNVFEGFNKAIYNSSLSGLGFSQTYRSDFSKNAIGIQNEGIYLNNAFGNTFKIGNTGINTNLANIHEGIIGSNNTVIGAEANTFEPFFTTQIPTTIGYRVLGANMQGNEIYRNTFKKTLPTNPNNFFGNLANGTNYTTTDNTNGLKYKCNYHLNNKINGTDIAITPPGIATAQGSLTSPALNIFSWGNAQTTNDINNNNSAITINYHYLSNGQMEPKYTNNVTKIKSTTSENYCQVFFNPEADSESDSDNGLMANDTTVYTRTKNDITLLQATLNSTASSTNEAEVLKSRITDANVQKQRAFDKIIFRILTNIEGRDYNELRYWLRKEQTLGNHYAMIESYLAEDNLEEVVSQLNKTLTLFLLQGEDLAEFNFYKQLRLLQVRWKREQVNIFALNTNDISSLRTLAEQSYGKAGDAARGLLNFAYQGQYFIPPVFPQQSLGKSVISNEKTKPLQTGVSLKAYPNPASMIVNFEYHTLDRTLNGAAELVIRNSIGQTIKRFNMTSDGLVSWNIEQLALGVYFYTLESEGNIIIPAERLVIAR